MKVLEIEVLETEIETLELEVESIRLSILRQRDPVPACNPKVKMLRERKVKERIQTFRIKRLVALAEELDTDRQEPESENGEPKEQRAQKAKIERYRAARFFQDDFVPMFDLRHSKTWKFVFVGYFDRRVRDKPAASKVSMAQSPSRFLPLFAGTEARRKDGQRSLSLARTTVPGPCHS
jgi:hypothetical protein